MSETVVSSSVLAVTYLLSNRRATAIRFAHEGDHLHEETNSEIIHGRNLGAKHLYLLDFDGKNLPEIQSTIETKYPDVKVCSISEEKF